jgi:hypothetical protein
MIVHNHNSHRRASSQRKSILPGSLAALSPMSALRDCVEKLENRAAPKISQMQRIDDLSRCNAL